MLATARQFTTESLHFSLISKTPVIRNEAKGCSNWYQTVVLSHVCYHTNFERNGFISVRTQLRPPSIKFGPLGVHPGYPGCSIVAASLVAVETDVGETISASKVAFVCGLWSVGVVALISAGPISYFCIHQLLFP